MECRSSSAACAVDLQRPGIHALGFVLEDAQHRSDSFTGAPGAEIPGRRLDAQFRRLAAFLTPSHWDSARREAGGTARAPTEVDPGEGGSSSARSMTRNTWALGGVAGHAGLFGTVAAVGAFARAVLATLDGQPVLARTDTMRRFIQPSGVPGSSRALGWDTMLPTSSCGTRLSPTAIGRTGFTGTSLWIDWERDLYVVLLTNRVHPTRENDAIAAAAGSRRGRRSLRQRFSIEDADTGRLRPNGRTLRQLKVTANRSAVRVGAGAAQPAGHLGWGRRWGRRKIRSGAATARAARHVGARLVLPVRHGLPEAARRPAPWHRRPILRRDD